MPDNVPGRRPATGGPALGQPRITPPQEAVAGARPVAERVRAGLSALPPARRLVVVAVRDVLLRAGAAAHRITLRPRADSAPQGIAFGVYTGRDGAPGACVYGLVTATTVEVEVGGVVEDGGCLLPAPGE